MNNLRLTDVVKNLLIINVLFFFGSYLIESSPNFEIRREIFALWYFENDLLFKPFQLITHFFMHADFGHLFFNMFGLMMLGPALESLWGEKRFLFYYLFAAFGSTLISTLALYIDYHYFGNQAVLTASSWGASGAIYGIAMGFGLKFPNVQLGLLFLPFRIKAIYFVMLLISWDLIAGFGGFNTGIGHFAHLGGALFGFLLVEYWNRNSSQYKR